MGIKDSPFPVNVAGVMGDASKCRAVGPGLAVNGLQAQQPTHFDIFTDGKFEAIASIINQDLETQQNFTMLSRF